MQLKTSGQAFRSYGRVYDTPIDSQHLSLKGSQFSLDTRSEIYQLLRMDSPVFIEVESGLALLLVGKSSQPEDLKLFAIHRHVHLFAGITFAVIALTPSASYRLYHPSDCQRERVTLSPPYLYRRVLPKVTVKEIVGYYYNVRNGGYKFGGEIHHFFELTFVDRGKLHTTIDGQAYVLGENDLIFYGPGQHHVQSIPEGTSCSYLTIMFDLHTDGSIRDNFHFDPLFHKVFPYDKTIYGLIKSFSKESRSQLPFRDSLLVTLLEEIVVRQLQSLFIEKPVEVPVAESSQYYQNVLLDKILAFIHDSLYESITVGEICKRFSISRTSLQQLFNDNIKQTPKRYISEMKLEKSCQLLREGKHSITDIAISLGYSSLHYFSRVFSARYKMPPSEYAKQIFNPTP